MTDESTDSLSAPAPEQARAFVSDAVDSDALVTLFGRCTVSYSGRAESELGPGDRHVMLKPDGTALVHTDEGHQPVNWQPPGADCTVVVDGDALSVRCVRSSPDEELLVRFRRIDRVTRFDPVDTGDFQISGTEADLKERILDSPALVEPGFQPLATERETSAGAVDIYGEDTAGRTVVLELKRRRVGPDAVGQLHRYVAALDRDLHADADIRGILVAPSVTDRARSLLGEHGLEFVSVDPA